jgi:sarcosine oxidase
MTALDRRDFLKVAGAGAGALLTGSRSTSGDEQRGVRSSYGDRSHGELWMKWAHLAIQRWKAWDAEYAKPLKMQLFFTTGDLYMRDDWEPPMTQTRTWWQKNNIPHEVLPVEEVRKRWPAIQANDIQAVLYEPNAGVVRARRATEAVAEVFRHEGGRMVIGRVVPPVEGQFDGSTVKLTDGTSIGADTFVFAVGPWLGKTFEIMKNRMRTPLGTVVYFGTPAGDSRFTVPNMPSWNFPGTTGWPGLPVDNRGFRVRGGGGGGGGGAGGRGGSPATGEQGGQTPPQRVDDPDLSVRWVDEQRLTRPKQFIAERFPALKDAPVLHAWSCHYEQTSSRNFIVDRHPGLRNVWIAGGGNAEGFKQGPVIGEYVAKRVLGDEGDPEIAKQFRIPQNEYSPQQQRSGDDW